MKKSSLAFYAVLFGAAVFTRLATAQTIPAATAAEKEAFYAKSINYRTFDIVKRLNLTDETQSNAVFNLIMSQYHELRVRDAAIDTRLTVDSTAVNYENREPLLLAQSKPLHDSFFAKLAESLTPAQIESVKDLMTYNKVKATYDAYGQIVPGLTEVQKAKILELLKMAREEAVDGGNAPEKSAIFQKYKDQINRYLDGQGYNTTKAFSDWVTEHPNTNNPAAK